jgi:ATP-dependent DNA helicase RecG
LPPAESPREKGPTEPVRGLSTPLQYTKGTGPQRARLLAKIGLDTVEDALFHLPARHEDRTNLVALRSITTGDARTTTGIVVGGSPTPRGRRRAPLQLLLKDNTGFLKAVWFNQPYLERVFKRGQRLIVHGKVQLPYRSGPLEMHVKDYEVVEHGEDDTIHAGRLVPVYRVTQGLTQRPMRTLMKRLVDSYVDLVPEPLPESLRTRRSLPPLATALRTGHFPDHESELAVARRRLIFDDFFLLELGLAIRRQRGGRERGLSMNPPGGLRQRLLASLPYRLTSAQERVCQEIRADMAAPHPMNRLLQGDVGSGKTIVATLAIASAIESGYQAAFMAPTEILAEQHIITLKGLLEPLDIRLVLLTNSVKGKARESLLAEAASGKAGCVIGTHALIQEAVRFRRLGLVVVDEQHRFGVSQRATLRAKGERPDVLVMTATPIPRTLALTLYGDLDVSVLDQLPPGRKRVITVARPEAGRRRIYQFLETEMAAGRQVYVVCPVVDESETLDLRAATEMAEQLQRDVFPHRVVGLLHGRLSFPEKERVMREFKEARVDVLVSTTVIEVGVDVPNASVMLIEHAERFGLSQLHQLRGRVGRGPWKSYCILLSVASSPEAKRRIAAMTDTNDGFKIAEVDLSVRGPGDFFGTRQSGLPEFRVADLVRDAAMLEPARQEAFALIARDPQLVAPEHRALRAAVLARWRGKLDLASVG